MRDMCTCPALLGSDYHETRDHCMRHFVPESWDYKESPDGSSRSLILKGRCTLCGGMILAGMPTPECFNRGNLYHFLFQQLQSWRPYAIRGNPQEYPAAEKRLAWYQQQDERGETGWYLLLKELLPGETHDIAMWFSGYQNYRTVVAGRAWPVGAVIHFKYEYCATGLPAADFRRAAKVYVKPFQEMKVTNVYLRLSEPLYCGLVKTSSGRVYRLDKVPGDKLYSMDEWSALLPERLSQPSLFESTQDFEPDYPPEPAEQLFVLKRTSNIKGDVDASCMAVSTYPELLKELIQQDVEMRYEEGLVPSNATPGSVEDMDRGSVTYTYRWTMSNENGEYLEYAIDNIPLLSAKVLPPKGGVG